MSKLVIRYDLDKMTLDEQKQYLRDVSEFLQIDPDLNAFDLINMPNTSGTGSALVPYARRGTCELLRDKHSIEILDQTEGVVEGSYVVRVKGKNKAGRTEFALGSRSLEGLRGRDRDDAIMTASTRALQRLTMQFTGLGILSESEVVSVHGQPVNPASEAKLAGSPMVIPQAPVNNAPGKPVEDPRDKQADIKPDISADIPAPAAPITSVESTTFSESEAAKEPDIKPARKPRKTKNTVTFDVEPERVSKAPENASKAQETPLEPIVCVDCKKPLSEHKLVNSVRVCAVVLSAAPSVESVLPSAATPVPVLAPSNETPADLVALGLPTQDQMNEYRTKIATYTKELQATVGMTATQRMRAFIAKMNGGTAPQNLKVEQWTKTLSWFDEYSKLNGVSGVIAMIDQTLGDR